MGQRDPFAVRPIGVVRSTLRATADAPNQAYEGAPESSSPGLEEATTVRVDALEAIDGTPIIDLKIALNRAF